VLGICWLQSVGSKSYLPLQVTVYFAALFAICMLCHGELARLRPDPQYLTAFYLTMSAGGAGGGLFVALLAPQVFPGFWEIYVGLVACSFLAIIVYFGDKGWLAPNDRPPMFWSGLAIGLIAIVGTVFASAVTSYDRSVAMRRNFYGVLEVSVDERDDAVVMRHGRIMHGLQLRSPEQRTTPTMYYGVNSGVGRVLAELRARRPQLRVGLVGLGVGTLAAYGREGDTFHFYEINDNVVRLAREHFTFLEDSPAEVDVVMGDARLSLENAAPQEFDLLVLDAFSGDAIPTHLLTREALQVCLRHVRPDGVIALHISNLHFDLRPVTEALAEDAGLHVVTLDARGTVDPATGQQNPVNPSSRWVLYTRDAELLESPRVQEIATTVPARRVLWTDDFSNLIQVLNW
jgi:SAM-dependent methyltransferase